MGKKINVAELLKDCPSGMELDSPVWDNIVFEKIDIDNIVILRKSTNSKVYLSQYGAVNSIDGKCVIFPKGKTTWEGFVPPCEFKDGDIVATMNGSWIGITEGGRENKFIPTYCVIKISGIFEAYFDHKEKWLFQRLATEEEKEKLFDAIKANGYKWNAETKTLEKLVEPKFKVGNRIKKHKDYISGIVTNISDDGEYKVEYQGGGISYVNPAYQDEWELVPNKFDINTLVPFESRVLVRDYSHSVWRVSLWGCLINHEYGFKYDTIRGPYKQCIPYENNEHLIGKTDDCDDYYKTWE